MPRDPTPTPLPNPDVGSVTQRIIERGSLICGVNHALPGFGAPNDAGEFEGFDVDICRAVAAAILGDASAVTYRPITAAERQPVLASGEVDLISRNTTFTLTRDTLWGASFAPTTFYDGQGVMVYTESSIASLEDLEGGTICLEIWGFFDLERFAQWQDEGVDWVTRYMARTLLFDGDGRAVSLLDRLRAPALSLQMSVLVGKQQVPMWLVAQRVPAAVYRQRLRQLAHKARRKQKSVSRLQKTP